MPVGKQIMIGIRWLKDAITERAHLLTAVPLTSANIFSCGADWTKMNIPTSGQLRLRKGDR